MGDELQFRRSRRSQGRRKAAESARQSSADHDTANGLRIRTPHAGDSQISEAEVLAAIDAVPALSHVVNEILSMTGNQKSSAADTEELVRQDMVITGRLLKLVNSPFYGLSNEVSSITQAVALIGMNSLRSLVVAASVSSMLMVDMSAYGYADQGLWQNSIATAALARRIVLDTRKDPILAENCFIAGLMRDMGVLVLAPIMASRGNSLVLEQETVAALDVQILEQALIGFDHVWVGQRMGMKWRLPQQLTRIINAHHALDKDGDLGYAVAVLRLSERLTNLQKIGLEEKHPFPTTIDAETLASVGLDADAFRELLIHVNDIIAAARMDMS